MRARKLIIGGGGQRHFISCIARFWGRFLVLQRLLKLWTYGNHVWELRCEELYERRSPFHGLNTNQFNDLLPRWLVSSNLRVLHLYCFLGVGVVHDQCLFNRLVCITSFGYCTCPRQGFCKSRAHFWDTFVVPTNMHGTGIFSRRPWCWL